MPGPSRKLGEEVERRFARVLELQAYADGPLDDAREYVEAMLGFEVWSQRTYLCLASDPLHDHGSIAAHDD
jgi:hypothetical protein